MANITIITGRRGSGKTTLAEALCKSFEQKLAAPRVFDDVSKVNKPFLKKLRAAEKESGHLIIVLENASDSDRIAEGGLVPTRIIHISSF